MVVEDFAACAVQHFEEVHREALVLLALVDEAVAGSLGGFRVELLPGLGLGYLVLLVVDQSGVGEERRAPVLVLILGGFHSGGNEPVLVGFHQLGLVQQPALGGELRGPDDVRDEDVALGGLAFEPLHDLRARLIRGGADFGVLGRDLAVRLGERLRRALVDTACVLDAADVHGAAGISARRRIGSCRLLDTLGCCSPAARAEEEGCGDCGCGQCFTVSGRCFVLALERESRSVQVHKWLLWWLWAMEFSVRFRLSRVLRVASLPVILVIHGIDSKDVQKNRPRGRGIDSKIV